MPLASLRRNFSVAVAALVSAVLMLPSGAAVADEYNAPATSEVETTQPAVPLEESLDSRSTADEPSEAPVGDDAVIEESTPTEIETPAADATPIEGRDAEGGAETADDGLEADTGMAPMNSGSQLVCEPGYVYSIRDNGDVYQINPGDSQTSHTDRLGTMGSGSSNYNGLGIGANGGPVYAYQRTQSGSSTTSAQIMRWDGPGTTAQQVATSSINLNGSLVAGAVDLNTGAYYFGGYEQYQSGSSGFPWYTPYYSYRFKVWRYNPDSASVQFVGQVNTSIRTSTVGAANGDIAFNSDGDLFFLISGSQSAIGTVTAEELAGASGGNLNYSLTRTMSLSGGGQNANGIAFDADGSIYLGTGSRLYQYDPTTWQQIGSYRSVLSDSTDLAGCNSPASLEVIKNVEDRKHDNDQFELTLRSGNEIVADAITEGSDNGPQDQQIGPVPVRYGNTYRISEAMANGSTSQLPTDYDSSYVCTVGGTTIASGEGTEFDVEVTQPGETISCVFTNSPVPDTQLTLLKEFDTSYGAPEDTDDWTLTATPNGGQAIDFAHNETQDVEAGQYTIAELFGDDKITPSAAGYELADITCTTDGQDNPVTNGQVTLEDRTATECVLTNEDRPGTVVWQKADTDGNHLAGSEWKLTGPEGFGDNGELIVTDNGEFDADDRDGYFQVEGLWWGEYELEEVTAPEGYQLLDETVGFEITGTDRAHEFTAAFENIAIPTLTLFKGFETQYGAPQDPEQWNLFAQTGEQELGFDHGETQRVEAGSYTLSESYGPNGQEAAEVGYELKEIVCSVDGGETQVLEDELTIENDTATECTFINIDLPGAVEWEKTNANGTPLGDSEWLLTGPQGFGERTVIDNGEYDVIETAGTIRVEGLHWGDYSLEETKAPAGFQLISGIEEFAITGAAREHTFDKAFVNEPLQPGTLPLTGVFSGKWPLIGAAGVALLVLTGLARTLYRRNNSPNELY